MDVRKTVRRFLSQGKPPMGEREMAAFERICERRRTAAEAGIDQDFVDLFNRVHGTTVTRGEMIDAYCEGLCPYGMQVLAKMLTREHAGQASGMVEHDGQLEFMVSENRLTGDFEIILAEERRRAS